jgi:cytochrome c556
MRIAILGAAMLCLLAIFSQVVGQEKPTAEDTSKVAHKSEKFDFWMKVKLVESQKLFAALAQADFTSIAESGQTLKTVSALEGFVRRKAPGYSIQLKLFEFSVDEILQQAAKENIEGVALGFQQLTLSCVNCHKQIRQ